MSERPDTKEHDKFKIVLDFLKLEATVSWQIFAAFLVGNNVFLIIIATLYSKDNTNYFLFCFIGLIGVFIALLWIATFRRNSDWYEFRIKQAKKGEEDYVNSIKDSKWYLLNRDAELFAEGVKIKGLPNKLTGYGMIIIFLTIYSILLFWSILQLVMKCHC